MSEIDPDVWLKAWQSVEQISQTRVIPDSKDTLLHFIEAPFREAVGLFYDKNIHTIGSSCNLNDAFNGFAWISLDG